MQYNTKHCHVSYVMFKIAHFIDTLTRNEQNRIYHQICGNCVLPNFMILFNLSRTNSTRFAYYVYSTLHWTSKRRYDLLVSSNGKYINYNSISATGMEICMLIRLRSMTCMQSCGNSYNIYVNIVLKSWFYHNWLIRYINPCPILLRLINFNPNMDK